MATKVLKVNQRSDRPYSIAGVIGLWLFWGFSMGILFNFYRMISPADLDTHEALLGFIATLATFLLVLCQRPWIWKRSRFRLQLLDIPVSIVLAYVGVNVSVLVIPGTGAWGTLLDTKYAIFVYLFGAPILEELIARGTILMSLAERMSAPRAIFVTSLIMATLHLSFWPSIVGEPFLCIAYLRRRSISASLLTHMVMNTSLFFPKIILAAHIRHFV